MIKVDTKSNKVLFENRSKIECELPSKSPYFCASIDKNCKLCIDEQTKCPNCEMLRSARNWCCDICEAWTCTMCTFCNDVNWKKCKMCKKPKPKNPPEPSLSPTDDEKEEEEEFEVLDSESDIVIDEKEFEDDSKDDSSPQKLYTSSQILDKLSVVSTFVHVKQLFRYCVLAFIFPKQTRQIGTII